jgi:hypothetical protein
VNVTDSDSELSIDNQGTVDTKFSKKNSLAWPLHLRGVWINFLKGCLLLRLLLMCS